MTPEERLAAVRYYTDNKLAAAVFHYGTVIVCAFLKDAVEIMRAYGVPGHGEGHVSGDVRPLAMDDGKNMFMFSPPSEWLGELVPYGFAVRVATDVEVAALAKKAELSGTEIFMTGEDRKDNPVKAESLMRACVAARAARSRDAKNPQIVASWSPDNT